MILQFIHLIVLCFGVTDLAGYDADMPLTGALIWLFGTLLILLRLLPAYTESVITSNRIPSFFKTYNVFCFIIAIWISLLFISSDPIGKLGINSSALPIGIGMIMYLIMLRPFMIALYEMLRPVLAEEQSLSDFLRARYCVPIIFFPPILLWTIIEDISANNAMELMTELQIFIIAPIFLLVFYIVSPKLFNWAWKSENCPDKNLVEKLLELSKRSDTYIAGVKIWNTFNEPIANAAVAGLIKKYRFVYITDYLLKLFTLEQTEAVVGHELGHLRLGHVGHYLIYSIDAILLAMILKTCLVIYFPYFYQHATLTYILEIILFIPFFAVTFTRMARHCERQADAFAASVTDKQIFASALEKIGEITIPKPKWLPKWLITHPETQERINNIKNNEQQKISSLIHNSNVLRYILLVLAIVLLAVSVKPASIVFEWSNIYNAAEAGNCGLVKNLCNSLPQWLKEHPFVIEQIGKAAVKSGNYDLAIITAIKATFGVDINLVSQVPHHSGSPEVALDFEVMQLVLKFLNFR